MSARTSLRRRAGASRAAWIIYDVARHKAQSLTPVGSSLAMVAFALPDQVPTAFVSDWLPASGSVLAESLACADSITVIEHPGVFPVPPTVRVKPTFTGPIIRNMKFTARDRHRLRMELGWPADALCIVVLPGGSASEVQSPIAELVVSAFYRLPHREKRLVWVSRNDYAHLTTRFAGLVGIEAIDFCDPIERLLGGCDLVITKGTRGATLDAAAVGVPSISISHGRNPVDELLVPRMRNNLALVAGALDAEILATQMMLVSAAPRPAPMSPSANEGGAVERVARSLIEQMEMLGQSTTRSTLPH